MIKYIPTFLFAFFILIHSAYSQKTDTLSKKNKFSIEKMYAYALQENVAKIIRELDSISDDRLTNDEKTIKEKYIHRFIKEDENFDFRTKDTSLIRLMKIYQSYWKTILLKKESSEKAENKLIDQLADYVFFTYHKKVDKEKMKKDFSSYCAKINVVDKKHQCVLGPVGSISDLIVWDKEIKLTYHVKLPEKNVKVRVIFMEDIVTIGWEEYATFGKYYPGGWSTKTSLFCVRKAYDTTSEAFKISYLKHEGQHFADIKSYPHLSAADLEYRAKLTELSNANTTIYTLIDFFIRNASSEVRSASHSFADYCLIRDLSNELFKEEFVSDINRWKELSYQDINKVSEKLLKQNSENLNKAGRKKITEFIK